MQGYNNTSFLCPIPFSHKMKQNILNQTKLYISQKYECSFELMHICAICFENYSTLISIDLDYYINIFRFKMHKTIYTSNSTMVWNHMW